MYFRLLLVPNRYICVLVQVDRETVPGKVPVCIHENRLFREVDDTVVCFQEVLGKALQLNCYHCLPHTGQLQLSCLSVL